MFVTTMGTVLFLKNGSSPSAPSSNSWLPRVIASKFSIAFIWAQKHCQRHNGPEGWVHITNSDKNIDQISISETKLNLNLKSSPNLASESWTGFNFVSWQNLVLKVGTKVKFYDQTSASKSAGKTVAITIPIINISNSNNLNKFWVGIFTRQGHINQVY